MHTVISVTDRPFRRDYAVVARNWGCAMLLTLMLFCAAGAVLLIALGAFSEIHDLWTHPEHRIDEKPSTWNKTKPD